MNTQFVLVRAWVKKNFSVLMVGLVMVAVALAQLACRGTTAPAPIPVFKTPEEAITSGGTTALAPIPVQNQNLRGSNSSPAWSPDGKRIAFLSRRDGNNEIYVMNADGSSPVNLTNHSSDEHGPAWSPDGQRIAFNSSRDSNYEIYVMNADGSEPASTPRHKSSAGLGSQGTAFVGPFEGFGQGLVEVFDELQETLL